MQLISLIQRNGPINSVAFDPTGGRLAVALGNTVVEVYRVVGDAPTLELEQTIPLRVDAYLQPGDRSVEFDSTRLLWRDDQTVLVARALRRSIPRDALFLGEKFRINLVAIEIATGQVHAEFDQFNEIWLMATPALAGSDLILVGLHQTVVGLDPATLAVRGTTRAVDESGGVLFNEAGEPADPEVDPDDLLGYNGVAYQPADATVYSLYRSFGGNVLESHRWDSAAGQFRSIGYERTLTEVKASGLCPNPTGPGVTAWLTIFQEVLDLGGLDATRLPQTARMGRLAITGGGSVRWVDVLAPIGRDLKCNPYEILHPNGQATGATGFRTSTESYEGYPTYLDEHRVALNTPSGLLLVVDLSTEETTIAHDFGTPIVVLGADPARRWLVAGCQDGTLALWRV